ncbi:MAG TPA: hypothetical protein PKJ47_03190 [Candidatus Limiplasma sp.]|nr:hypothetical protein [Candidatus Limiplasma sp.]
MDRAHQNELKTAYRNQEILGGIYCIQCVPTRQVWVRSARNLTGAQNKFAFAVSIQCELQVELPPPCHIMQS